MSRLTYETKLLAIEERNAINRQILLPLPQFVIQIKLKFLLHINFYQIPLINECVSKNFS